MQLTHINFKYAKDRLKKYTLKKYLRVYSKKVNFTHRLLSEYRQEPQQYKQ